MNTMKKLLLFLFAPLFLGPITSVYSVSIGATGGRALRQEKPDNTEGLKDKIDELTSENKTLKEEIEKLKKDLEESKKVEVKTPEGEAPCKEIVKKQKAAIASLKADNAESAKAIEGLTAEIEKLKKKTAGVETKGEGDES